jgi:toxin ParE1/3/4
LIVRWTERASKDAIAIYDYIADRSEGYAESVYLRILSRPSQLADYPESGSIVPEYNHPDVRELFVHSFRLIYRVAGNEIRILTVIHGRRQLPTNPGDIG